MAYQMPQVPGVSHRFIRVREVNFHVAAAGEGDPVLLLHGWPEHWYAWRKLIPRLAERYRVLALDLRGFGWSDIAWEGFEKESMADDVAGVLAELDIRRTRLIGHDWGGWIGFLLALSRPELVERLVALNTSTPWALATPDVRSVRRLGHSALMATPGGSILLHRSNLAARVVKRWAESRANLQKPERRLYVRDLRASTRARAGSLMHRTFLIREAFGIAMGRYRDQRLSVPTLLMLGANDPIVPTRVPERVRQRADELQVEVVKAKGHFLPEEAPRLVFQRATEFFDAASRPLAAAPGPA
jgi:pimeloyl-ACP methyl ester carboxylesterase